ncbi:TlpA family protein disulfide reductase [Vaginella massiliensis]|uniref:TlpA family protein disulfide reductase n=1 Tax=Vaginella massiliensis TaxID=1816680 RepID=UPI00083829EA|nr:TlpA disulfide reductase family protein [Vaginella massiliensis]
MKNIVIGVGLLLSSYTFAQFKIEGSINNYPNQMVTAKINTGSILKLIDKSTTNQNGNFILKIPTKYNGIVELGLANGETIKIMSDNQDVSFKATSPNRLQSNIEFTKGGVAQQYQISLQNALYEDLRYSVFEQLKNYYNPTDEFYTALQKEINRIEKLSKGVSSTKPELLTYYLQLNELAEHTSSGFNKEGLDQIVTVLKNDDQRLEQSGLMNVLILNYLKGYFTQSANTSKSEEGMKAITDQFVNLFDLKSSRGQMILANLINIFNPKQFPTINADLINKAKALSGNVHEDLKYAVFNIEGLKVGERVPNFNFDKAIKGKKSLYDVKANQKLVVFWASWCPACVAEMPYIKDFYKKFKVDGGEIVAVSLDVEQQAFDEATKDLPWYNTTELLRWDSEIARMYGVNSTPTLFLLDKDNKLIKKINHINEL